MVKLIVLEFYGNFDVGFKISMKIKTESEKILSKTSGFLPPDSGILTEYTNWQQQYKNFRKAVQNRAIKSKKVSLDYSVTERLQEIPENLNRAVR